MQNLIDSDGRNAIVYYEATKQVASKHGVSLIDVYQIFKEQKNILQMNRILLMLDIALRQVTL